MKIYAHDPYIPSEIASSLDFTLTSLDKVLSTTDVIILQHNTIHNIILTIIVSSDDLQHQSI